MRRLAAGEWVGEVLECCTGCMSCDAACPNGAHPYGLLLERFGERYLASGIPRVFCNAMPQRDGPNLWHGIDRWLGKRERDNLELWAQPPEADEVLFLGCNQRLTPYIADTAIFKDLAIFSDPAQCCGEYYLRLGLIDEARKKAAALAMRFEELGIKKVVAFCPACQNTMLNLAPRALGVGFGVEVTGLVDWISGRIASGHITPLRRFEGTATVQDPCHASFLGERSAAAVRDLLRLLGLDVVEMESSGVTAECCGLGASLGRYRLTDVMSTGFRRARQSRGTGAGLTCAWCNGCYTVMNMFRLLYPQAPPVYHLLELLQMSVFEKPERKVPTRSLQLVASAVEATALDGFRFGRTHL
jgi:Fe-S oxidoreductase